MGEQRSLHSFVNLAADGFSQTQIWAGYSLSIPRFANTSDSHSLRRFALHGLDRVARGCRIAYYQVFKTVEDKDDHPTGYVTVLSEDTIRVSIRTRQSAFPSFFRSGFR